jgi:hypothetical protein
LAADLTALATRPATGADIFLRLRRGFVEDGNSGVVEAGGMM